MRIISGKWRGKRLTAPSTTTVRPTMDFAKESLFNILSNTYQFDELRVIDLFSGTGNIAFEFGSRGAKNITCVEIDKIYTGYISKTSKQLELPIKVVRGDVYDYLQTLNTASDIIFADPPYALELHKFELIVELVFKNKLLSKQGLLVIEHSKTQTFSHFSTFQNVKRYGISYFSFFKNLP